MPDRMLCWSRGAVRCLAWAWVGLLAVALVPVPPASGQTVRAVVSADSVHVGERFMLSLVATHHAASPAAFPQAEPDTSVFGDVEALARSSVATRHEGTGEGRVRIDSVAYEVTTFAIDTAYVPAISVRFIPGPDTVHAASTPFQIPVRSVLSAEPEGLRGLAPLALFPRARWPWVFFGLGALALAAGLAYYWYRRRRADKGELPPPSSVPPHEEALQRLRMLEETTDWSDPEALERFFVELSTTVRVYVARRTGIATLERTTHELIGALRSETHLPTSAVDATQEVLTQADLVKFADRHPSDRAGRVALRETRSALDALERALQAQDAAAATTSTASHPAPSGTKSASNR